MDVEKGQESGAQVILRLQDVGKDYGRTRALDNVTFDAQAGEFVVLLGPNGAGKSTLVQLVTGLVTADRGRLSLLGHDMARDPLTALARLGVVFQSQTLDLELTVLANLRYHADLHGLPRAKSDPRITELLCQYDLESLAKTRVRKLSGGNRRRVELVRALLHRPAILLMDEATNGLDPLARHALLADIHRLVREEGLCVIWATHVVDEVEQAHRLVLLNKGQLIYNGSPRALSDVTDPAALREKIIALLGQDMADRLRHAL